MCIIAVVPPKHTITDSEFSNMWNRNDDGGGFAYAKGGKVIVRKGFMKKEDMKRSLFSLMEAWGHESPFIIHFRIRTHGACDAERTHPFRLPDGSAFMHNGVLSGGSFYDKEKSDTQLFLERYAEVLAKDALTEERKARLEKAIGYNKFVILRPDKSLTIVNRGLGTEDKGRWFSNASYRTSHYNNCAGFME